MNKIVEQIIYSEGSYWGEDGKFKFRTQIDNYTDASEVSVNTERLIRTNFTVTLNGYLIPEEFNNVVTTQKRLTPKRIIINDGVGIDIADLSDGRKDVRISVTQEPKGGLDNPLTMAEGTGVTVGNAGVFDGSTPTTFTIGIGQPVGLTDTVQFQNVTSSGTIHVGPNSFEIKQRDDGKAQVSTDWVVLGDIIAENYIVSSSITSMSIAQASGSTVFGDTVDDSHEFTGSLTITGSLFVNGEPVSSNITSYNEFNRKCFVKKATEITVPSTASFSAITASAPTDISGNQMTPVSENDFLFFLNGQYMEHDALVIQQTGSIFKLLVDNNSIGYDLESDDEIIAWGKFNS